MNESSDLPPVEEQKRLSERYRKAYAKALYLVETNQEIAEKYATFLMLVESENLNEESKALSRLTRWLIGLTIGLGILAIAQLVLIVLLT